MPIFSNCQVTANSRNGYVVCVDIDTTGENDAQFLNADIEYSTDGGGFFQPIEAANNETGSSPVMGDTLANTQFTVCFSVGHAFNANQSVIFKWRWYRDNVLDPTEDLTCAAALTADYPLGECASNTITDTSANVGINTGLGLNGGFPAFNAVNATGALPANSDTFILEYGTTPGGPYPNVVGPQPVNGGFSALVNIPGLTPSTTYYYRVQVSESFQSGTEYLDFGECSFTTLAAPVAVDCQPATLITPNSATLNGTGDNIPVNQFIRLSFGTANGGPYGDVGPNIAGTNIVGQSISRPIAGLTASTTYYYVVEHLDTDGTTVLTTSSQCQFSTLAPATVNPECNPATFIQFDQADLQGTVDGMAANDYAVIEYGTTPGGPYPTKSGATPGDTTVNQLIPPVPYSAGPLTPGTYYYRVGVYDDPGANTFLEASSECSFTIPASTVDCGTASNPTATTIDITATAHNVLPNWIILWEFATVSGGPYTQAFADNGDGTPNQAINDTFGGLTPNTTYFYRWTVYDEIANEVFASPECGSFQTLPDREAVCDPATLVDTDSATLNGTLSGLVPGDQYRFRYGTTPGGPYGTTLGPFPAANGPVSAPTGDVLTPGTTYYYILEVWDGFNVQATSGECSFATTPPPLVDPCEAATNVTPFFATLNATAVNVPAGYTRRFRYGTAPGVYTNTVPAGVFSGASPEAYSANIAGLTPGTTYYYTSEVLDPGLNVVAESPVECSFVTQTLAEGGLVSWCGAWYDSNSCIPVDYDGGGADYFYCAGADSVDGV